MKLFSFSLFNRRKTVDHIHSKSIEQQNKHNHWINSVLISIYVYKRSQIPTPHHHQTCVISTNHLYLHLKLIKLKDIQSIHAYMLENLHLLFKRLKLILKWLKFQCDRSKMENLEKQTVDRANRRRWRKYTLLLMLLLCFVFEFVVYKNISETVYVSICCGW